MLEKNGDTTHIFWKSPVPKDVPNPYPRILNKILQVNSPLDPLIFPVRLRLVVKSADTHSLYILILRKMITLNRKKTKPPSITQWMQTEEGLYNRSNDCESAIKSGYFPSYACLTVSHCTSVIERYWLLQQNYYCNRIVKKMLRTARVDMVLSWIPLLVFVFEWIFFPFLYFWIICMSVNVVFMC